MSTAAPTYEDFLAKATANVEQQDRLDLEAAVLLAGLVRRVFPTAAWVEMEENEHNRGCMALSVYDAGGTRLCEDAYFDVDTALGGDASDQLQELGGWMQVNGLWAVVASEWITTATGRAADGATWFAGGYFLDVEKALAVDVEKVMAMTYGERVALAPDIPSDHVHRSFVKGPVTPAVAPPAAVPVKPFPAGEEITCGCGNRPDLDGFSTSDETGALKCDDGRNPSEDWDGIHYVCDACEQVWAQQAVPATE